MRIVIIAAFAAVVGVAATSGPVLPAGATPVAVELFTSQGCSSCPPADALFEKLVREPNIIPITRPVTYWDRLGWKDTLALESNTALQQAYAAKGGEGAGVYTPQAVVQGGAGVVGSSESKLRSMITAQKRVTGPDIRAVATADGGRTLSIGAGAKINATVSVLALKSVATVRIGRGENGGRTVRYTNVLLSEESVGRWTGSPATLTVPGSALKSPGADRHVVIVRAGPAGRIVAARYI
jgi:hypothetical protein